MRLKDTKYAYPEFRYGNDRQRKSVNIGDNIQSIAVRELLVKAGIQRSAIVGIDRDSLRKYQGDPVRLVMNGCFRDDCFPVPPQIEPIFFGFNAETESLIRENKRFFLKHAPIGCRDAYTKQKMEKHGISAYVTGCATLTFPKRPSPPEDGYPIIAFGQGSGVIPCELLSAVPKQILENAHIVFQREATDRTPLADNDVLRMEAIAQRYLDYYRDKASLVITPLLHVASPCLAMGVPVILMRRDRDPRFTAIDRLLPLYTPSESRLLEWSVRPIDSEPLKAAMTDAIQSLLAGDIPSTDARAVLAATFDAPPIIGPPQENRWHRKIKRVLKSMAAQNKP